MTRQTLQALVSVSGTVALLALPSAAAAKPPVGECPASFEVASVFDTPPSFLSAAMKIDNNDDLAVCFKPMANATRTNVIDNISQPN